MSALFLGITGFAQVGKDEAATRLVSAYGFERIGFADPLRKVLYKLNPTIRMCPSGAALFREYEVVATAYELTYLVDRFGWDAVKVSFPEVRQLLQRLGTEAGREVFGDQVWVELAFRTAFQSKNSRVVFPDVRFENEADAIFATGGAVIRIVRPGVGAVNSHKSDAGLPDYCISYDVVNDGSLQDLHAQLDQIVGQELGIQADGYKTAA